MTDPIGEMMQAPAYADYTVEAALREVVPYMDDAWYVHVAGLWMSRAPGDWKAANKLFEKALRQRWKTPSSLVRELELRYGGGAFTLDVAAEPSTAVAGRYYSPEDDGLCKPWSGSVFCNPPYDDVRSWTRKAIAEWGRDEGATCTAITMLLPSRTDQRWFHELRGHPDVTIVPIQGRVQFKPPPFIQPSSNREGSIVAVFHRPLKGSDYR